MYSEDYFYHPSSKSIEDVDSIKEELGDRLYDEIDDYEWMEQRYSFSELVELLFDGTTSGDELRDQMRDECWDEASRMINDAIGSLEGNDGTLCLDYLDTYCGMKYSETRFT